MTCFIQHFLWFSWGIFHILGQILSFVKQCEQVHASVCKSCTTFTGSGLILCRGRGPWTVHVPVDNFDSLPQLVRVSLHLRRKWMQIHGQMTLFSIFWSMRVIHIHGLVKFYKFVDPVVPFFVTKVSSLHCNASVRFTCNLHPSIFLVKSKPFINICAINPFDNIVHKLSSTASVHTSLCPHCVFS